MVRRLSKLRRAPERFFADSKSWWIRTAGEVLRPVWRSERAMALWTAPETAVAQAPLVGGLLRARNKQASRDRLARLAAWGNPLVSVIVPVHDASTTLQDAVSSLLNQSYPHLEILLIDDGSSDESAAMAMALSARDRRVGVACLRRSRGAATARNVGLSLARGAYLCFQDADDRSDMQRIERQLHALLSRRYDLCTCDYRRESPEGRVVSINGRREMFSLISMMFSRALWSRVGYLRPLTVGEDTDYFERLRDAAGSSVHLPKTLYYARFATNSLLFSSGATTLIGPNSVTYRQDATQAAGLDAARRLRQREVPCYVGFEFPSDEVIEARGAALESRHLRSLR